MGIPRRIDEYEQSIVMLDKSVVKIDDILIIEGDIFEETDQ